ncbi:hypothetical protein QU38_02545 [Staphylococcus aureus]|uniref:Uncharacterized protein n=1 Tax=Staphylococcus aureus TaxID=1280 RepID=A0AA40JPZ7_STAAU|nr:hypothetical protein QU38_02545 [Staphylococcus aureus]
MADALAGARIDVAIVARIIDRLAILHDVGDALDAGREAQGGIIVAKGRGRLSAVGDRIGPAWAAWNGAVCSPMAAARVSAKRSL